MSIKSKLEYMVKFNRTANLAYTLLASTAIKATCLASPIKKNQVLFSSDIGKNYTGSPRAIYERMIELGMDSAYDFIWAFTDPEAHRDMKCKLVKLDTPEYFKAAISSQFWITDVNIERGLRFKRKKTKYLNTWHGSTLKTLGNDIHGRIYYDCSSIDYMCVNSNYDKKIFAKAFGIRDDVFIETGLPRNDLLYSERDKSTKTYKERIGLPIDKKLILYAPTWRDSEDRGGSYTIAPPVNLEKWQDSLAEEFILGFRMHPLTQEAFGITENAFLRDFSKYQPLNDLLLASDILITDYSSLAFDFSILRRPVICFGYDISSYGEARGLYADLNTLFPYGVQQNEDQVIELLKEKPWEGNTRSYLDDSYNQFGGSATEACIRILFS